jgi:hypothetical protein
MFLDARTVDRTMCHFYHARDRGDERDETDDEADEERWQPDAFDDERETDVEVLTDGGDAA